ncbi:MAG: MerR family transcriptional regulator [Rubellimicrobium sp.]|nr:MerR family transcriptional regulator [Rubellimicrobium sp.]
MSKSDDAFRTIGEVSDWLGAPAHVLRFWESKFAQIRPVKRAGGRRYYRPEDVALLGGIKFLLHEEGMTIKGVQKLLREQGVRHVAALSPRGAIAGDTGTEAEAAPPPPAPRGPGALAAVLRADPRVVARRRTRIAPLLARLRTLRARLQG